MKIGAALVALLFLNAPAIAQSIMQFEAFPPNALYKTLMGAHGWTVYANGPIDENADKRLEELLRKSKIAYGSTLYLNSLGGNLYAGMKLGRVIRKNGFLVYVGKLDPNSKEKFSTKGHCLSACAMAFLGGEYRFWIDGSVFGVHRFFWEKKTDRDADLAQMMSAAVVEYIRSMDVHTDLFTVASQAGKDEMIAPTQERLIELNVINNGVKRAKWTIESVDLGMYLKGEQETWNGINKVLLVCPAKGPMFLHFIFDPGQNADQVMTFGTESLQVNDSVIDLEKRKIKKEIVNGWINATYHADEAILNSLRTASRVGILMQPTREAAFFSGFNRMPFEEGAKKLPGMLQVCRRS